ncbi:protein kinase [Streptomyces sp. NBC_01767]|uniref:protein kinase n=1 Tax=Streptomyces sp. NBC_01767 TaxID=2975937 RepID=UPI00225744A1|nr:protein kinase [Streptomyces sp. NBC_01767]MCX4394545.1 protein kinase [Streptomyces sp. NBC_01767]
MDDYAGRVLADRYRLPLPPDDAYETVETRAFDTYSGQEVLVRQVPLPEVVDAEVLDAEDPVPAARRATGGAVRMPADPAVRRAVEAAQAAAQVPDHPRLDQVFDVFAEAGSLWIVSELVAARPLASLLAERPLNPFRAAEIGSDVLTALRVLHAHGWTHRNITVRTVLICDDGRVVLTGLAAGAAEEALCGYVTTPQIDEDEDEDGYEGGYDGRGGYGIERDHGYEGGGYEAGFGRPALGTGSAGVFAPPLPPLPPLPPSPAEVPASRGPAAIETGRPAGTPPTDDDDASYDDASYDDASYDDDPYRDGGPRRGGDLHEDDDPHGDGGPHGGDDPHGGGDPYDESDHAADASHADDVPRGGTGDAAQLRAGRAGAIVAYREGARAAARVSEDRRRAEAGDAEDTGSLPVQRSARPHDTDLTGPSDPLDLTDASDPSDPSGPDHSRPQSAAPWSRAADDPYSDDPYTKDRYADDPYAPGPHDGDGGDGEGADDDEDGYPPPRRLHLTGSWSDGPDSGRPVPAGGSGEDALRADARRHDDSPALPAHRTAPPQQPGRWDEAAGSGRTDSVYRGPATPLAAERARQTRIAVVGAVTERWAPEQAGPVHENWRLAPPIGPATDLWALGALLYRAVQGHAPYPEENAAELVQMVCGEPPAFAEECGPLRPVVESLLRQDPTERPDFEELSGWLRSLVRSAPEPEAGLDVVPLPSADTARLPVVRRRGELVRRRRGRNATHGRHRHTKNKPDRRSIPDRQDGFDRQDGLDRPGRLDGPDKFDAPDRFDRPKAERVPRPPREPKVPKALRTPPRPHEGEGRAPRRLGRLLLVLILLALAAAVAYAVMFMPRSDDEPGSGSTGPASSASGSPDPGTGDSGGQDSSGSPTAQQPQTSRSAVALAPGYTLRKDQEGFEVGVLKGWQRSPANADRQIRYGSDGFSLLIVPGRDTVKANGDDPLTYQADKELELQPFRDSSWSGSSGLRRIDVGRQAMAEGQFTWQDASGREVYARNLVMVVEGRYHVVQVIGPENRRDKVSDIYEQAVASYRVTP